MKVKVKFNTPGKWSSSPREPTIIVKAGDVVEVSSDCAEAAVCAGKAEYWAEPGPIFTPATKDKAKAEGKHHNK